MKHNKLIALLLALMLLSLLLSLIPAQAFAASSSEIRKQINKLKEEKEEIIAFSNAVNEYIAFNKDLLRMEEKVK